MQRKHSSVDLSDGDDWDTYNGLVTKSVDVIPTNALKNDENSMWIDEKLEEEEEEEERDQEKKKEEEKEDNDEGSQSPMVNSSKKNKNQPKPSPVASDAEKEEEEDISSKKEPIKTKPRSVSEPAKPVAKQEKKKEKEESELEEEEGEEKEEEKPSKSSKSTGSKDSKINKAPPKKSSTPTKEKESEDGNTKPKPKKAAPVVTIADFPRSRMMISTHKYNREEQRFSKTLETVSDIKIAFDIVDDLSGPLTELIAFIANKSKDKGYALSEELDLNQCLQSKKGSESRTKMIDCFKVLKQHLGELKEKAQALVKLGANLAAVTGHYLAKSDVTEYDAVTKNFLKWAERAAVDHPIAALIGDTSGVTLKAFTGLDSTLMDLAPSEVLDRIKAAVQNYKMPRLSDKKIVERCQDANLEPEVVDRISSDDADEEGEEKGAKLNAAKLGPLSAGKMLISGIEADFGKKLDKTSREMEKAKKLAAKVKLPPLTAEDFYLAHRGLNKPPAPGSDEFTKASRARTLILRHLVNVYLEFKKKSGEAEGTSSSSKPERNISKSKAKPGNLPSYLIDLDESSSQDSSYDEGRHAATAGSEDEDSGREEDSMEVDEEEARVNARESKTNKVSGSRASSGKQNSRQTSPESKKRKRSNSDEEDDDDDDIASRFKAKKVKRTESDEE